MATARPTNSPSDISGLRARALQSVFPGMTMPPGTVANSPATPPPAPPAPVIHLSAATRVAQAVAAQLAAHPKPTPAPYVPATRANTPLTQSAGTINTNYVNSARAQGYNNVTPPDIFRGMRDARGGGFGRPAQGPDHTREFFRNQVFVPPAPQARQNLFAAPPVPPMTPQIGQPAPVFPPRNPMLNVLFPR